MLLLSQAHEGRPLVSPDGQPVKKFHAYGPQWADMAKGSGYETVVHKQPLLKYVQLRDAFAVWSQHCTGARHCKGLRAFQTMKATARTC